jgi:hypothetical protein
MSLTPAYDQIALQRKKDAVELCGKNRGPHDYFPIEWKYDKDAGYKRVTRMLCRVCFCNVSIQTLMLNYPEISFE